MRLTHQNEKGEASMVDVGAKELTARKAKALAKLFMKPQTLSLLLQGNLPKGDALAVARVAGIMAAKKTPALIPLCHSLSLDSVEVNFKKVGEGELLVEAVASCFGKTGVEMEAMTAVTLAALTIYDMCKGVEKGIKIGEIYLAEKSGGKSGDYRAESGEKLE
ncbi:MAG TPA: cyclic pyranopterin monophosphate synthase MoaC [Clostridiales bacterium]|jgi:cyclic pyranopterin phosphate synthase|nr:cyclic pyranopterin monophosphate synthase MoaC [Clostridiales bacterium]HRT82710.1 cyclic pyranopterin monophosphate synthase MoaC [Oscillospiraceae bacterium]